MYYSKLAETYQKLENITGKLKMTDIVANLFQSAPEDTLPMLATLVRGKPFPTRSQKELEVGESLAKEAISIATGATKKEIEEKWRETGDLGKTAGFFLKHRKQMTLTQKKLTVDDVLDNLDKIAKASGSGSQKRKVKLLAELITVAEPLEARYIVRTVLEELRVGVGEGIVRDAIAQAFEVSPELVERAYFLRGNYGKVITIAKEQGEEGLNKVEIELGTPIKVMLAQKATSIEEAFEDCGKPAQFEYKYDGFRMLIHKKGEEIQLFSRRLEAITKQFPEI
ncbi:MAG: DNA ligase, partial [Candidatus Korarchaeota archaeon]|nr:DNA ligase [Candidatus Korarchaeota archaeon]NIU82042.1 DNA ligase [Candidatus Thorarchaeota archaeon]NIW12461.1 DNA ligase [Candidatus Thorarchaeota archaeon]NIW50676.1 DNA ligase [Candidatus Korarchaeota archaeon]